MGTVAACSEDDALAPPKSDAGLPDSVAPVEDSAIPDKCPDAGQPVRSCTAAKCSTDLGEPAVCVADGCVKIKTLECQSTFGPIENDDAILIGQLADVNGADKASTVGRRRAIELAIKEINETSGGIYTEDGCGRRPLALVTCDDSNAAIPGSDGGTYSRAAAAAHLAKDLKVAAILGPQGSGNTVSVAGVIAAAKTLLMPPTAGAAEITDLPSANVDGTRLIWRVVPTDALQAKAVARVGEQVQAQIKTATGKTTLKAAIVNRSDTFGRGLRDGIKAGVSLNGTSWADPSNTANVMEREYTVGQPVPATIKDDLIAFQPDVVFFFGLGEIFNPLIAAFEDGNTAPGATKPYWISSASGQRNELLTAIANGRPTLRGRTRGTSSVLLTPLAQDFFNNRYKTAYPDTKELVFGMAQSYDSLYLAAYAIGATKPTRTSAIVSFDVAKAMTKVTGGTVKVDVGPSSLKEGLEAVRKGEPIEFNGATGPLDFNPAVGEAPGDYAVWCVRLDPNDQKPIFENATGMKWNFQTNALEGTFNCP